MIQGSAQFLGDGVCVCVEGGGGGGGMTTLNISEQCANWGGGGRQNLTSLNSMRSEGEQDLFFSQ